MQPKQRTTNQSPRDNIPPPTPTQAKVLTKRELSRFLGISERFIELEVSRGRLQAVKLSDRLLRFRPIDVEQWMKSSLTGLDERGLDGHR
jgi:excisionase family DNA binding protein